MSKENCFVFVVCGTKEHIDTLHYSLNALKNFSKNDIYVLTDSSRNEIEIEHQNIVDITTDKKLNHHQASIYLKTRVHKFLPKENTYCYLDTDVIALSNEVDLIFNEYRTPITFAPDHCKMLKFSPYSVNCGCKEQWEIKRNSFEEASLKFDKNRTITDKKILEKQKQLKVHFEKLKLQFISKFITAARYFLSFKTFYLNKDFSFDKQNRVWKDRITGAKILYEVDVKKIEAATGFKYNKWAQQWLDQHTNNIWQDECTHLSEYINETFCIKVKNKNWQHWNGGVFLFDDNSHEFLDAWHNKTMHIFTLPDWKTRDQGTLIATVWEFGLENHKTLNKKWNFIADYNKAGLDFKETGVFTDDFWETKYKVNFIHIYHHWGDTSWSLWNWLKK